MKKLIRLLLISISFFTVLNAEAAITPIGLAIFQPVQFPSDEYTITGARLSLLSGRHRNVYGFDFAVVSSITDQEFTGIGLAGGVNITHGTTTGIQLAGIGNYNTSKATIIGLQAALGANVNTASSTVTGFQIAAVNLAKHTTVNGFQIGLFNQAETIRGFQIGIINRTAVLKGIQLGLLNFHERGKLGVSPVINIGL